MNNVKILKFVTGSHTISKNFEFFANTCMFSHDYCGFQDDKKVHHEKNYCGLRGKINMEQTVGHKHM